MGKLRIDRSSDSLNQSELAVSVICCSDWNQRRRPRTFDVKTPSENATAAASMCRSISPTVPIRFDERLPVSELSIGADAEGSYQPIFNLITNAGISDIHPERIEPSLVDPKNTSPWFRNEGNPDREFRPEF